MLTRFRVGSNRPHERLNLYVSSISPLPKSYTDVFNDPNWQNAMCDEYNALIKNNTWSLVPQPTDANLVDGTLSRYKARLVANGSTQLEGIDVDKTFRPVVKPGTIQTILSLATFRHWPVHQVDVKNAFLHGDLSETVYMHQPLGFQDFAHPDYGLKASFETLLQQIIASLHQEFSMTDLGSLNYFLGISVTRDSSGMFLSHCKYAAETLEQAHMANCNPSRAPVDTESKLGDDGDPISDPNFYRSAEAEYCGVANAVAESCWLRNLLHLVVAGQVRVLHALSRYQYVNIFTKGLPSALFEEFHTNLSVRCPPAQTAWEYYYSEDEYAVSIKEDTVYPCLHSPKTSEDETQYAVSRETQYAVFNISNEYNILEDIKRGPYSKKSPIRRDLDNSTNNVLIPLDSWTSGLLVYRLPLRGLKIEEKDSFGTNKANFIRPASRKKNQFSGSDNEDANEHIEKVLEIVDLFHVPNITVDQLMLRVFPISLTGATSRWLRNKATEPDETLYKAWERFKELLMKCPQHYLTEMQEIKKVNEKVYAAQVGCEQCKGPHYTKDCPLKEERKTLEEAYYTQFGRPFQEGDIEQQLRGTIKGTTQILRTKNEGNYGRYLLSKFMSESAK
ncbi:ribonuclease H-like domain-containing protein [Tanacetum coccineum]